MGSDRTQGLDQRRDLTGILVRLMSSVTYPRLSRASGELLLATCGGHVARMTAEIGYGPCAGFLVSIGQGHALPKGTHGAETSSAKAPQQVIDPITGKALPSAEELARQNAEAGLVEMSEEEKEAEAERLFGLFDRLERTGIVKVAHHPMQQAVDSGSIKEMEENEAKEEAQRRAQEEKDLETTVEREMKQYRSRATKQGEAKGA